MNAQDYIVSGPGAPRVTKDKLLKLGYNPAFEDFLIESVRVDVFKKNIYLILYCLVPEDTKIEYETPFFVLFFMFIAHDRSKMVRDGKTMFTEVPYKPENVPAGYKAVGFGAEFKLGFRERRQGDLYNILLEVYGVKIKKSFAKFQIDRNGMYIKK